MVTHPVNANNDVGRHGVDESAFQKRNHRAQDRVTPQRSQCKVAVALLACIGLAHAQETPRQSDWRVRLEPTFMHAATVAAIPGARKTEFAAGFREGTEFVHFLKPQFALLHLEWPQFFAQSRANADEDLGGVECRYVRDRRKVIEYAVLKSTEPIMASAVLATRFSDRFKETLGEKPLVAVPNAYTAYAFPRLASDYQQFAPMVIAAYHATAFPVSLELFEITPENFRAVGIYEEP